MYLLGVLTDQPGLQCAERKTSPKQEGRTGEMEACTRLLSSHKCLVTSLLSQCEELFGENSLAAGLMCSSSTGLGVGCRGQVAVNMAYALRAPGQIRRQESNYCTKDH